MSLLQADHLVHLAAACFGASQQLYDPRPAERLNHRYRPGNQPDGRGAGALCTHQSPGRRLLASVARRRVAVAQQRASPGRRLGLSLIEMLVAAAILLASVALLSQLADVGTRHARQAESLANAQRICQNILNEILAGAAPLEPVEDMPLLDEPGWSCSVAFEPLALPLQKPQLGILRVTVTEQSTGPHLPTQFTLWRLVRVPATFDAQSEFSLQSKFPLDQ
jgi:type II secretory pathway pseudopilin PulG